MTLDGPNGYRANISTVTHVVDASTKKASGGTNTYRVLRVSTGEVTRIRMNQIPGSDLGIGSNGRVVIIHMGNDSSVLTDFNTAHGSHVGYCHID